MELELTTTKVNDYTPTYLELFDCLEENLKKHYLLTESEREECVNAISVLKRVFGRFGGGRLGC
jgi:hypothetical protein